MCMHELAHPRRRAVIPTSQCRIHVRTFTLAIDRRLIRPSSHHRLAIVHLHCLPLFHWHVRETRQLLSRIPFQHQAEGVARPQAAVEARFVTPKGSVVVPWYVMTSSPTRRET
ncbi:hypothetical protein OG21DRAFT_640516 [Imleria badia]|nr:hypothetical protein OG21DRAFT_640516 [Imleria badia]